MRRREKCQRGFRFSDGVKPVQAATSTQPFAPLRRFGVVSVGRTVACLPSPFAWSLRPRFEPGFVVGDSFSARQTRARQRPRGAAKNTDFQGPGGTCMVKSVFNLQHPNSFEWENPPKLKNAATADGFCLLVFLKMRLVHKRRRRATATGT
jgi:hypothetical protein